MVSLFSFLTLGGIQSVGWVADGLLAAAGLAVVGWTAGMLSGSRARDPLFVASLGLWIPVAWWLTGGAASPMRLGAELTLAALLSLVVAAILARLAEGTSVDANP